MAAEDRFLDFEAGKPSSGKTPRGDHRDTVSAANVPKELPEAPMEDCRHPVRAPGRGRCSAQVTCWPDDGRSSQLTGYPAADPGHVDVWFERSFRRDAASERAAWEQHRMGGTRPVRPSGSVVRTGPSGSWRSPPAPSTRTAGLDPARHHRAAPRRSAVSGVVRAVDERPPAVRPERHHRLQPGRGRHAPVSATRSSCSRPTRPCFRPRSADGRTVAREVHRDGRHRAPAGITGSTDPPQARRHGLPGRGDAEPGRPAVTVRRCWWSGTTCPADRDRAALAEARDKALEGTRREERFLANMSHELRTPLNAIIGYPSCSWRRPRRSRPTSPRPREGQRRGPSLLTLIDDILDLSKIEAGFLQLTASGSSADVAHGVAEPWVRWPSGKPEHGLGRWWIPR